MGVRVEMRVFQNRTTLFLVSFALACLSLETESFSSISSIARLSQRTANHGKNSLVIVNDSTEESPVSEKSTDKVSLEDKMKSWEASEEELKAATLGGVIPQSRERTEAFDVGLYIAFPIMVITGLAFAFSPLSWEISMLAILWFQRSRRVHWLCHPLSNASTSGASFSVVSNTTLIHYNAHEGYLNHIKIYPLKGA